MKYTLIWFGMVILACISYLVWLDRSDILQSFLGDPSQIGDFLAGITALFTLPSLLFVLYESKQNSARELKTTQLQTLFSTYDYLNNNLNTHAHNIRYHLDEKLKLKATPTWNAWRDKENIFGYLKASHFSTSNRLKTNITLQHSDASLDFIVENFGNSIEPVIDTLQSFKDVIEPEKIEKALQHQAIQIYNHMKCALDNKAKKTLTLKDDTP